MSRVASSYFFELKSIHNLSNWRTGKQDCLRVAQPFTHLTNATKNNVDVIIINDIVFQRDNYKMIDRQAESKRKELCWSMTDGSEPSRGDAFALGMGSSVVVVLWLVGERSAIAFRNKNSQLRNTFLQKITKTIRQNQIPREASWLMLRRRDFALFEFVGELTGVPIKNLGKQKCFVFIYVNANICTTRNICNSH